MQVFGKYIVDLQEKIDNIEGKLDLQKNEDVQKFEIIFEYFENNYLERLQKLEGYIQKKDLNFSVKYVECIYVFLLLFVFKIKELFCFVIEQVYLSFLNSYFQSVQELFWIFVYFYFFVDLVFF